jgi:hypothetical protein
MKRHLHALFLLFILATSTSGCASWVEQWKRDPIAALNSNLQYLQTALGLARGAFDVLAAASPEVAAARPQFEAITTDVNRGLLVAQDGVRVAADAHASPPDSGALLHDAQTAMGHLHDFIQGVAAGVPGRAPDPVVADALRATERAARLR